MNAETLDYSACNTNDARLRSAEEYRSNFLIATVGFVPVVPFNVPSHRTRAEFNRTY